MPGRWYNPLKFESIAKFVDVQSEESEHAVNEVQEIEGECCIKTRKEALHAKKCLKLISSKNGDLNSFEMLTNLEFPVESVSTKTLS